MNLKPSAISHISSLSHSFQSVVFYLTLLGMLNILVHCAFKCNFYFSIYFHLLTQVHADPSGRSVWGVVLRPQARWDCGFESRRGRGYLCLVSVVCCQVSSIGLRDGLITRTEESYRVWCVQWVWSWSPARGCHEPEPGQSAKGKKERKKTQFRCNVQNSTDIINLN